MQIEYTQRGQGWRGRGRPTKEVPQALLDALRRTYEQGTQATMQLGGATDGQVKSMVLLLEHGVAQLGGVTKRGDGPFRLRQQADQQVLRFYMEDKE